MQRSVKHGAPYYAARGPHIYQRFPSRRENERDTVKMKQRVTYLLPQGTGIDPNTIGVRSDSLDFAAAQNAALEKRIIVGLSELPQELRSLLKDTHELHLRWSSSRAYHAQTPLVSRLPAGLHVFHTPRKANHSIQVDSALLDLLDNRLNNASLDGFFTRPHILSERFSASAMYQYYHTLPSLYQLRPILQDLVCTSSNPGSTPAEALVQRQTCKDEALELEQADSLDIDFDVISHAVVLTAYWSADTASALEVGQRSGGKRRADDSIEVGVLQVEKPTEPEELALGGYLIVIGEDDHPSATMFSFPSRHHPLPAASHHLTFSARFQHPTGLHPKLNITFANGQALQRPVDSCALHAYWTLPSALFLDRYQLSDTLFLRSQNLIALRALSGADDLEAPDWVVKQWGSAALLELAHPTSAELVAGEAGSWTVTVPTHLRYLPPSHNTSTPGYEALDVPWPALFWACEAEEGLKMATNPFDRVNLGYDGLFGPKTMFYHIPPSAAGNETLVETLLVPVLDVRHTAWVRAGTLLVVALGFGWVTWRLLRTAWPLNGPAKAREGAGHRKSE